MNERPTTQTTRSQAPNNPTAAWLLERAQATSRARLRRDGRRTTSSACDRRSENRSCRPGGGRRCGAGQRSPAASRGLGLEMLRCCRTLETRAPAGRSLHHNAVEPFGITMNVSRPLRLIGAPLRDTASALVPTRQGFAARAPVVGHVRGGQRADPADDRARRIDIAETVDRPPQGLCEVMEMVRRALQAERHRILRGDVAARSELQEGSAARQVSRETRRRPAAACPRDKRRCASRRGGPARC